MYHKKEESGNSTIETKIDKLGNKISMHETSNGVDEDKVTKDTNISFSRGTPASLPSGIVEYSDKNDTSLMIEVEEMPPQKTLEILKMMLCFYWMMRNNLRIINILKKMRWMGNMKNCH